MPETPAPVVIACTAGGKPFSGAYALVRLPMWQKNQYVLAFGPSGDDGLIRISGAELAERARQVSDFFVMDYQTFPDGWSGGVGAEILSFEGIQGLRSAMETYGPDLYPSQFADDLDAYEARLRGLQGQDLQAEVARIG